MISPQLTVAVAQARIDDLRRAADARRAAHGQAQPTRSVVTEKTVTLRFGTAGDEKSLARLAPLDSAQPPEQPALLAEVDGQPLAALALSDGTVITDPFHRTADLVDLLRARARQLNGDSRMRHCGRLRSWTRLRPRPVANRSTRRHRLADAAALDLPGPTRPSPVLTSIIEPVRSALKG